MFFKVEVDKTFLSLSDWQEVFRDSFCNLNSASTSKKKDAWAMAFTPSPTSVNSNSNFSLIDSISDITTLDMSDDNNQPAPNEEDFPSRPSLEKEGSLNSLMITIIVSPPSRHASLQLFYRRYHFLQVNDAQFRLDSHFLERESETLKAIIASSKSDSIHLQDVSAAEFRALWRFFYEG